MTIVFFSNFINHHQKLVADCLYNNPNVQYYFVETIPMYEWLKKGGYSDYSSSPYVIKAWESEDARLFAVELAKGADVALFGGGDAISYAIIRARNTSKLSFEVSERWLKKGLVNVFSPRLIKNQFYYHTLFKKKPFYKLCSSAFGAQDQYRLHSYIGKCYKWGYFTKVDRIDDIEINHSNDISIMWCSRFIGWKHPELPILLAVELKKRKYRFVIDMYGSGEVYESAVNLANTLGVSDVVRFCGNVPNEEVLAAMRCHRVFLFTSDKNEGWGAVANEAMSSGCILVASDEIGSVPYLVSDSVNGFIFKSAKSSSGFKRNRLKIDHEALNSLTEKVIWLIDNPDCHLRIATNAYRTMKNTWSPENAAHNLLLLIDMLSHSSNETIESGPCSKAINN